MLKPFHPLLFGQWFSEQKPFHRYSSSTAEMIFLRAVRSHNCQTLLKLKNPFALTCLISSNPIQSSCAYSIYPRPFSLFSVFNSGEDAEPRNSKNVEEKDGESRKPLDVYFKEAVGLSEKKFEDIDTGTESDNAELKKRLRKLEVELRNLKVKRKDEKENKKDNKKEVARKDRGRSKHESEPVSLSALFGKKTEDSMQLTVENPEVHKESIQSTMDNPEVYKELSSDMQLFANHLYKRGYFKSANFLPRNKFDVTCFENSYGRDFLRFAAEQFGKDNQEIAKWLSGSDLKKVALFGCPSHGRKTVFSAKSLRTYFRIQENIVCSKCPLKESCKFVNQSVWNGDSKNLNLAVVMRVITLYAMESVPPKLVLPDEIKASVSQLLKEVVNLSKTVS